MKNRKSIFQENFVSIEEYGDQALIRKLMFWIIAAIMVGLAIGIVAVLAIGDKTSVFFIGFAFILVTLDYFLFRSRNFESGVTILAIILITLVTIMATNGLGIHHISVLGFPVILLISSLVINTRRLIILVMYVVLCIGWLVFGEIFNFFTPTVFEKSIPTDFLTASSIIVITAFSARMLTSALHKSTKQLRVELLEKKQAEDEIRRLNEELDQRVIDRTAQLEAANKELETFSYSVSHDLRAPLRTITSFSNILLEDYQSKLDPVAQNYLVRINQNAAQMGQLINDLLDLSRLNLQDLQKEVVDMNMLAKSVLEILKLEYQGRQIDFEVEDLPTCQADPVLIRQVLINLFSNAIKYTRPRSSAKISISAQENPGETIYAIRDNGVGFDSAYSEKLFGVFQRLHPAAEFEGTGLGLATVQRIIRRHGGRVWADSELNQGAVFYFSVPNERTKPRSSFFQL